MYNRLVLAQDGNLRQAGKFLVYKYDNLNRNIETGLWGNSFSFQYHILTANNSSNYPLTTSNYEILTLLHYDDYSGLPSVLSDYLTTWNGNFSTNYSGWPYPQNPVKTQNIKGKIAWTQTRVLGTSNFIYSVSYYDLKDRVIQTQIKNLAGGLDVVSTSIPGPANLLRSFSGSKNLVLMLQKAYRLLNTFMMI